MHRIEGSSLTNRVGRFLPNKTPGFNMSFLDDLKDAVETVVEVAVPLAPHDIVETVVDVTIDTIADAVS